MKMLLIFLLTVAVISCMQANQHAGETFGDTALPAEPDKLQVEKAEPAKVVLEYEQAAQINTGNTTPNELLAFAKTLQGIPYKYASTDAEQGFDCSGFITYVFNHFKIAVPRSSKDFTNIGTEVSLQQAKAGDIVLFTGTDSTIRIVGHMGIIAENSGSQVQFIHSTSGKANGVTITPLSSYYMGRFVKVIRIFPQHES